MQVDLLSSETLLIFRVSSTRDVSRAISQVEGFSVRELQEDPEFTVSREIDNIDIQSWYSEAQEIAVATGSSLYTESRYRGISHEDSSVFLPEGLTTTWCEVSVDPKVLSNTHVPSLQLFLQEAKVYL